MRSNKLFYFFITDAVGRSAYWENDMVKWQGTPRPLEHSPDGWKEIQPSFDRSSKYQGINRTISTPFKFVEDGANILRYFLYKQQSYESKLYFNVNKWNDETDIYEGYYAAEIDLVKASDNSATGITVNLIEGNFLRLFSANDETAFEIPVTGVKVQLDGIALDLSQPFGELDGTGQDGADFQPPLNHVIPLVLLNGDGNKVYFEFQQVDLTTQVGTDADFYKASDKWIIRLSELSPTPQTFTLKGTFNLTLTASDIDRGNYLIYGHRATDAAYNDRTSLGGFTFTPVGTSHTFNIDQTFTLQPGEKFFLAGRSFAGTPGDNVAFKFLFGAGTLTVAATSVYAPTLCNAVRPYDLYKALLEKIGADSRYNVVSTLLDDYKHLVVTSMIAIRQLQNAVIKTSFAEFFKAFNAILFAGFGASGLNLIFERRQYFFDPSTVTLDLGETSELNITIAEDQLFNTGKFGYQPQDIEALNGRFSFNNTSEFKFPLYKVSKAYEAISPYITDCYLIENRRINLDGKTTTDDRSDNRTVILNTNDAVPSLTGINFNYENGVFTLADKAGDIALFPAYSIFIVSGTDIPAPTNALLERSFTVVSSEADGSDLKITVYDRPAVVTAFFSGDIDFPLTLRRENYDTLTGVNTDTVYNIEDLTPKRILQKHAPVLRSMMYWQTQEKLEFTTADKNKDLVTVLDGVNISESSDVRADTLGTPLFYPFVFTFKTKVPKTFINLFYNSVNGHVQFNYNGFTFYGFPIHLSVKPDLNESQEWKLLASPANNINQLVNLIANPTNNLFMSTYGLSFSRLCPVQFVPQGLELLPPYNFRHMDAWTNKQQKGGYIGYRGYCQQWQTSDIIRLQCITRELGPVNVYLVNKYDRVIATYSLQSLSTPAIKPPYILYEGDVSLTDVEPGCYRLKAVAGIDTVTATFVSEWLDIQETHDRTLLFEYTHNKNMASTIFTTGYTPSFRVAGNIVDFVPKSRFSSYEDQVADINLLDSVRYRLFTLLIGNSYGVPDWVIDKVNAIMNCNNVDIDGKGFTRNEDSQFEALNPPPGVTSKYWTLEVREAVNRDNISLTTDGQFNQGAALIYVDTILFGDLNSQVSSNPVQIEVLENKF